MFVVQNKMPTFAPQFLNQLNLFNQTSMNHYETVFILTPVLSDVQMKEAVEKFKGILTAEGAAIVNEENWGLKKLALEVNFRRDERVIRFLTFKQDKYAAEYAVKRRSVKSTKKED